MAERNRHCHRDPSPTGACGGEDMCTCECNVCSPIDASVSSCPMCDGTGIEIGSKTQADFCTLCAAGLARAKLFHTQGDADE